MKAARYFERRALHSILLLLTVSFFSFAIAQLAPGSFLDDMKMNPQISAHTIDTLRVQYGLDQPLPVRYFRWLKSAATGDFGYSLAYNLPVSKLLGRRLCNTLLLGASAMLLAWAMALPAGIWSAYRNDKALDRAFNLLSTLLLGAPELALALLFLIAAAHYGKLPVGGMSSDNGSTTLWKTAGDFLLHLIVPATVLALASFPILFRHIRSAMVEAWNSPFLRAARGHGIGDARLLLRHALPAAANPLISLFGLSLAALASGSFLVEVIVGWPGLGPFFLEAIYARDFQAMVAIVVLFSVFLIGANLIAVLLLYAAEPRVRAKC